MKKLIEITNSIIETTTYGFCNIFGIEENDTFFDTFLKVTIPLLVYAWLLLIVIGAMLIFTGFGFSDTFVIFLEKAITVSFVLIIISGIFCVTRKDNED